MSSSPPDDDGPAGDETYEISPETVAEIPTQWESVAVYTMELPARCPHCREPIRELHVLRLTRAKVSFTSNLPRSGRAIVCPLCEKIISAELGGGLL
jgi:hypothetical protein